MYLKSLNIQGYRNLTGPVAFGPLETINVVHGPNNAGKSNLLQAMDLYFRLLAYDENVSGGPNITLEPNEELTAALDTAFNRYDAQPLTIKAEWGITTEDMETNGLREEFPCDYVFMVLEITPNPRGTQMRMVKFMLRDKDVAALDKDQDGAQVTFACQLKRMLSDNRPFQQELPIFPLAHFGAPERDLVPQGLRDRLFDVRQSIDLKRRRRWDLFAELGGELADVLGPGRFDTAYDRETGRAELIWNRGEEALSVDAMGAGAQQMVRLLAELCLCEARYIAMEEPEYHLSPTMQERLLTLARRVVEAGLGPRQFFITTHSPTVTLGGEPFSLEVREGVPVMANQPWLKAPAAPPVAPPRPAVASMPSPQASPAAPARAGGAPDLGSLINVVEDLAALEPDAVLASARQPGAPAPAAAGNGAPSWKWGGGKG